MSDSDLVVYKRQLPVRRRAVSAAGAPLRGLKALTRMTFGTFGGLWSTGMNNVLWRMFPRAIRDYQREVGDGMESSLIMAPIMWMMRTFPEAPIEVLDSEGEVVEKHEMVQLLRRPNPFYSGISLWMATILSWVVDGNGYWIRIKNELGRTLEVWYVPHWLMEPISTDDSTFITKYRYTVGGKVQLLDPEDVIHFRYGLDPRNPRKGMSPLGTVLREVFTDDEAGNFAAALLHNMGVPGLIVSPDGASVDPSSPHADDLRATKTYVEEEFRGERRGKPLVMSGPTKVEQFGFNPQQMQTRELRRVPEERVTAALGMPAIVVGFGAGLDRSTFANYAEAREAAYEQNIIPTQRLMAEELRHQMLPDFEDNPDLFEVAFNLKNVRVLQEDRNKEGERLGNLYQKGLITRAEGRKPLGLDISPADEVFSIPIAVTLTPAGDLSALEDPIGADEETAKRRQLRRGLKTTAEQRERVLIGLDRDGSKLGAVLAQELELDFDSLGRKAAEAFSVHRDEWKTPIPNGNGKNRGTERWKFVFNPIAGRDIWVKAEGDAEDENLVRILSVELAIEEWADETLKARLEVHYGRVSDATVATINSLLDIGVNLPDEVARKIIADGGTRRGLIDVEEATKEAIFRALHDARVAGEGADAAARRIRQYVPAGRYTNAGAKYRAEMIARTETKNAQNISSLAAYKASDTVSHVVAYDGRLGDSDANCEGRDGEIFTVEDAEGEPLNHPNCTLSFAPIVGGGE